VCDQVWRDWLQLRRQKKAAVTQTVLTVARKEAGKAGMTLEAFLTVWCARGSQGLEAAWLTTAERGPQARASPATVPSSAAEDTNRYLAKQAMTADEQAAAALAAKEAQKRLAQLTKSMTVGGTQ
jgi:hypothetical protein